MNRAPKFLVFEVDGRQYGVPLDRVDRVLRAVDVTPLPKSPYQVLGVIDVHGTVAPVFDVRRRVGAPPRAVGVQDQLVIVRSGNRTLALAVERVREIVEIDEGLLSQAEAIWPGWNDVQGAARLATGLIVLEDVDRFLSMEEDRVLEVALKEHAGHGG